MMSKILDAFKGARKIEVFLAIAAIAVLLLQGIGQIGTSNQTSLENRLEKTLSQIEGVGRVSVMIVENENAQAEGALVVAEGADDIGTCLRIQYAVSTLLNLNIGQIEVVPHTK